TEQLPVQTEQHGAMFVAVLISAFLVLVTAQDPRPCFSPTQWEGRFFREDWSKNFTQIAGISYDELNRRVREIEEIDFASERDFYDVLYLHNLNVEYRLNLRDRKCNVTTLSRPFIPFGVPPFAHYDGQGNVGPVNIANEHVTVILFSGEDPQKNPFFGAVSSPDCVPISSGFFSNATGFIHTTFFDISIGIADPSVFSPPPECRR
ncbi:hypothetical protein MP969_26075, partial [Escherichia coli]|nr:hypothetical protein [Escherichia coli]